MVCFKGFLSLHCLNFALFICILVQVARVNANKHNFSQTAVICFCSPIKIFIRNSNHIMRVSASHKNLLLTNSLRNAQHVRINLQLSMLHFSNQKAVYSPCCLSEGKG